MEIKNNTLFTDLYQLTMMYGYYKSGKMNEEVVFDLFFRRNPFKNGYSLIAGLEQAIEYIQDLSFSHEDINYLRSTGKFTDEDFFKELRNLRFTGELYAMPEGTVAFPNEPVVRVKTRLFEAQLIETALLTTIGHQSLIATKADRIVRAAEGKPVMDLGARRAHGPEAATYGARASFIGGAVATSNVIAGQKFDIPIVGTMAHSWVMSFDSELEAFETYSKHFPDNLILLVDTYNVLKSGVPNAIKVFTDVYNWHGKPAKFGIRLDSGDLTYLSKEARKMLNEAGFHDARIIASNDLDEHIIKELQIQGAAIDDYGVGTKLITAYDQPAMGCVYKLAAEKIDGEWVPRIKKSENPEKITNPGAKKLVRFFNPESGLAIADLLMLEDEEIPTQPFEVFDPVHTWKRKTIDGAHYKELLQPIFVNGELVYKSPTLKEIAQNVKDNLKMFSPEQKRFLNPHEYHIDLSEKLWNTKMELLQKANNN